MSNPYLNPKVLDKPGNMTNEAMLIMIERVEEINEIIVMANRENRMDIVDTLIDELSDIEARLAFKGDLQ